MGVQINGDTGNISATKADYSGNVTIGGTLTYEDVTNIDSVGLVTARSGIEVGARPGVAASISVDGNMIVSGISTFGGDIKTSGSNIILGDSGGSNDDRIKLGASGDLAMYHDGSNSYIEDSGTGKLNILSSQAQILNPAANEAMAKFIENGAVELYHDNSKKLETASGGVTVTGTLAATAVTGDGSGLTGLAVGVSTASAQVSGITTVVDISKDDIRLDVTGNVTIDTKGGEEGQSKTLRIVNSGISTVSFNSYFKFPSGGTPNLPTASGAISLISFTVHTQGRVGVASVFLAGASVNFS